MNLKKTFVSFMAAGAVLAGGFAGVAAQDVEPDTLDLTVTVTNEGVFSVEFCEGDGAFDGITLDSENSKVEDRTTTTDAVICYTDTQAKRGQYTASLRADNFIGTSDTTNVISNENLSLGQVSIMNSGQWGDHVGAITAIDGSGTSITRGTDGQTYYVPFNGPDFDSASIHVHNIWEGAGTAGTKYQGVVDPLNPDGDPFDQVDRSDAGSWQEIELKLEVPVDAADDTYTSTLTIEVTSGGTP